MSWFFMQRMCAFIGAFEAFVVFGEFEEGAAKAQLVKFTTCCWIKLRDYGSGVKTNGCEICGPELELRLAKEV